LFITYTFVLAWTERSLFFSWITVIVYSNAHRDISGPTVDPFRMNLDRFMVLLLQTPSSSSFPPSLSPYASYRHEIGRNAKQFLHFQHVFSYSKWYHILYFSNNGSILSPIVLYFKVKNIRTQITNPQI